MPRKRVLQLHAAFRGIGCSPCVSGQGFIRGPRRCAVCRDGRGAGERVTFGSRREIVRRRREKWLRLQIEQVCQLGVIGIQPRLTWSVIVVVKVSGSIWMIQRSTPRWRVSPHWDRRGSGDAQTVTRHISGTRQWEGRGYSDVQTIGRHGSRTRPWDRPGFVYDQMVARHGSGTYSGSATALPCTPSRDLSPDRQRSGRSQLDTL